MVKSIATRSIKVLQVPSIGLSGEHISRMIDLIGAESMTCTVKIKYNAEGTLAPTVKLYTSPNGKDMDTDVYASFQPSITAGAKIQKTAIIEVDGVNHIFAKVVNEDDSYTITNVRLWFNIVARPQELIRNKPGEGPGKKLEVA